MGINFLRGNPQAPRGHAILVARNSSDPRIVYSTYCVVPPIPMSLAKYLPPMFAAQIPADELQGASSIGNVMPIPPMLEDGMSLDHLEMLAERRDDDLCDIGSISARDDMSRMQMAATSSQEYAQLYVSYISSVSQIKSSRSSELDQPSHLDDLDAEELVLETMPDRQKLAELGKLVGTARYALEGHDTAQVQETKQRMERIVRRLADKYRGTEIVSAAVGSNERDARLAELYLSRAFKLLDEEYADIPGIERAIRELQE